MLCPLTVPRSHISHLLAMISTCLKSLPRGMSPSRDGARGSLKRDVGRGGGLSHKSGGDASLASAPRPAVRRSRRRSYIAKNVFMFLTLLGPAVTLRSKLSRIGVNLASSLSFPAPTRPPRAAIETSAETRSRRARDIGKGRRRSTWKDNRRVVRGSGRRKRGSQA